MKKRSSFSCLLLSLILTGCWDQQLLKDSRLVYGSSFDVTKEGEIETTSAIRVIQLGSKGGGQPVAVNEIISGTGNTLRESRLEIDRILSGEYSPNKTRVFVLGEELAKKDIYPIFDILYRDPRSSLGSKVVVVKGKGSEIIKMNQIGQTLISEDIVELVKDAEKYTLVPNETVQSICTLMFDPGKDFYLPYIEKTGEKSIKVMGVALFNEQQYTGKTLSVKDSPMLLLLHDRKAKLTRLTLMVNPEEENRIKKYITIDIAGNKRDLKVSVDNKNKIHVNIDLHLKVNILEYAKNELSQPKEIEKLTKKLAEILTSKSTYVIDQLQDANCDALGIGRELMAYYPESIKGENWEKMYPMIDFQTNVYVDIIGTGIIK
ncbi:Ger(x)C family spore germination protein [Ammoniphilus resinae]|uniref:Ger(X)C family germination protein n=1 Tax=Ammoniphilus resinae TaxID=861532 RepID=A0ABS4GP11_9BACL|nr:Ger(x)C family spore germination protein [Ammoniphilus resinae]MBP1931857.1 Ger(x)C family germination protein [Ammoniphilus resinae]